MVSSKVKVIVVVFALFLLTCVVTVGCKQKTNNSWVNTNSMPGRTFSSHGNKSNAKNNNSTILYLGSDSDTSRVNFGPKDVSFDFRDLR